ncbi:hypothetical protein [Rathayibacter sp. VKM Ac-2760]|uniref:hypothetical protein n=1 Tax=Rathayibacter sp. VKM Ac-2760 TaxID=2609253 RepID=UPI0013160A0C|nr:hypothetical protein [Rathayibacter sp. VKM Ac-2760]QHC60249.1 hypothetical protein GSU72_18095 [Rathayibacter sp. VKM Ac-2760]
MTKWWWPALAALGAVGVVVGGATLFAWTVSETQFERPDPAFDRLTAQVASIPGVSVQESARWVEAPVFLDPSSRISLEVDEAGLPAVLDTACTSEYGEHVAWSFRVRTDGGNAVSVHGPWEGRAGAGPCPEFGVDPADLLGPVDGLVRGLDLQAAVRDGVDGGAGRFSLLSIEDPAAVDALLPLVAHAEDLRDAAGVGADHPVEISGSMLSVLVRAGEQERYAAMLAELIEEHGVTGYFDSSDGTQIDGVDKVQVTAPESEHAAIEEVLRDSGLSVAELPVRFLPAS